MRIKTILLGIACTLALGARAQTNFDGFSYQAVVRDANGDPLASQAVGLQVVIQVGPSDQYIETHTPTTDAYGLIAITVGHGTPDGGSAIATFGDIEWASGQDITYTVKVDVDGGTNYAFLSGGPFKAVPFAYHALTSDSATSVVPQTLSLSNDTLYLSGGNNVYLGNGDDNDWVLSGDTLHSDGRRVGIGTSSPDTTLHVVGKLKYQDGTQGAGKVLTSDADGNASWGLGAAATGWALNGTHLYNTNTGNVGVGTTTATSRLHVAAPYNHGTTLNLLQSTNSWGTPAWFNAHRYIQTNYAGNPAEFKQFNVGGGGVSIGYSNVPIYGSADALYVSGRVGLGTTAPDAKLTLGTPGQTWTDYGLTSDSRLGVVNGPGGRLALILTSSAAAGVVESFNYASGGYAHTLINPNGGNVGIGTTNPTQKLTVAGDALINGVNVGVGSNPANSNCGIGAGGILTNNTTGKVNLALGHAALYYNVTGHGNVGVGARQLVHATRRAGTTPLWVMAPMAVGGPDLDLLVESPFTLSNSIALGHYAQPTADNQARIGNVSTTSIGGSVGWSNFSDGRFKTDVRTDEVQGLSFITRLTPVTYRFDQDLMSAWFAEHLGLKGSGDWSSKRDIESIRFSGFIAQDVERVAAEVGYDFSGVDKPKNAHDHYSLRYAEFVVPLVKAVQELDERTKATDPAMLNSLLDRLALLEAENAQLQQEVDAQRSVLEANTALMLELQGLLNSPPSR